MRRGLFWLSRTRPLGWVVRLAFARLAWLLPVRRASETAEVLAFEHPAPSWQPHILLVPRRPIRSLLAARPEDARLVGQVVRLAFAMVARRGLGAQGFALLVNGGTYQDVPQLHFHLAGLGDGLRYAGPEVLSEAALVQSATLAAFAHPIPQREVHAVIVSTERLVWGDLAGPTGERIGCELLTVAQRLVTQLPLGAAGFTLLASVPPDGLGQEVCFHLVAGGRTLAGGGGAATYSVSS